ncbi:enolase-phosphatase E1 isoform X4 [Paralichthys olivaceus]|uniref:enolase-phosphatase E1 isoform X4 n=1 Tax=Paralichthys olivaceus TaxID=8255 RepID=UPI003750B361
MGTQGTGRKRSTKKEKSTAEDDALNLIAREAEARLAAKRAARAEAREIRMKELERQQKEIFQVQKKYYGLNTKFDERVDNRWGDIEQWMEDSERYSRSSQIHMLSDDDERMSVGSRGSVRSDLDAVGAYAGGGSSHKKSKKKKKHKHKDRDGNGNDDDYSVMSSRSSRLSDESRVSRASRLDLTSSRLSDDNRLSRASRSDLQPTSDLYGLNGLSSRNAGSAFNGYQNSLYEDSICSGSRRVTGSSSHPLEYSSYRSSGSRASSRAGSARASPVDNCSSVASFLRSAASSSGLPRDLDDVTIPDFADVEDRDYLEKGSRAASSLTATTLTSLGGTSSRRGSGETAITVDAETSIREIKEIHELKDQIQDVETKYTQNLKEVKDTLSEVEEKYRKAMVSNAQLDNEKNNLMYQVDTLKDSLMELEELLSESQRGYEEKVKDYDREKHAHSVLQFQFNEMKETLKQSEELLNEIRQLRMKQDGFVREISDLQETVEWKDKKIGALERQKEYTDAIRTERDELREEAVKLKDILKKHGIVLGPDLNINGDIVEAEVDGSSGDSAQQPAQESQTSPAEGNSMLGNTDETEEVDPDQHQEIVKEEAQENQLSSDKLCDVAVSTVETSSGEQTAEEQQTCLSTVDERIGESDLSKDLNIDIPDHPITEAKDIIVTSAEENSPDTETSRCETDLVETETESSSVNTHRDDFKQTCNKLSEKQENKQEEAMESNLSTESCPQQKDVKDIAKDIDNVEAKEIPSKSQGEANASGKRKKKKRRGKKKGNQQKDETEKENSKTEHSVESDKEEQVGSNTTEPNIDDSVAEILKESKMDQVKKEQVGQQIEEAEEAAKALEPTETFSHKEAFQEPNEHDKEQTLKTETIEELKEVAPSKPLSCTETREEIRVNHETNEPNKDQSDTADIIEVVAPTETFSHIETPMELCKEPSMDEQGKEETEKAGEVESIPCPQETHLGTCDLTDTSTSTDCTDGLDNKLTYSVDKSVLSTNGHIIQSESKIIDNVEDEDVVSVDEMKPECKTDTIGQENTEDESHVPSNIDVAADLSESTNVHERIDLTSVLSAYTDDVTSCLKSLSDSKPQPEPSSLRDDSPIMVPDKDPEETTKDIEEAGIQTEQESFPLSVTAPCQAGGNSELKQDGTQKEELERDLKEPGGLIEPESSSHDENGDSASLTNNPDALDIEKGLLETEAQVEHLDEVESQTLECVDLKDESNARETDEIDTTDKLNTPDSQKEEEIGSSCSLAEHLHESSEDKREDDSSQPNQQGSDEEDGEDEEGQSFDFDDMDVEAAFQTNAPENKEEEIVEEGVEVVSDPSENTQNKPTERNDETSTFDECNQVDKESETIHQDKQSTLAHEEATADEARPNIEDGAILNVVESGVVAEDTNQATSFPVEEGLDKQELQGDSLVSPERAVHVASDKEPPHSSKDVRKNSKKGKGKGKEDCKMS